MQYKMSGYTTVEKIVIVILLILCTGTAAVLLWLFFKFLY